MKRNLIIHVYYGTAGNVGMYIKQTIDALKALECDVMAFVNAYYLFDDEECHKVFFKHTEYMERNRFRKYFKYIEMILNFNKIYRSIRKIAKKYEAVEVVYSLNECYKPAFHFIQRVKKIANVKLGILVHDIVPFQTAYINAIYVPQNQILEEAEFYVAHNNYTSNILREKYPNRDILQYRFPLLDLSLLASESTVNKAEGEISFLFLGFLRKEKGIDILLDAWSQIEGKYNNAYLIIAGKVPEGVKYDFSGFSHVKQIDRFLTDEEYGRLIQKADYAVLPYIEGTNSGVLSTISCYKKPSITSDLPMFKESEFTLPELSFSTGSKDELAALMAKLIEEHKEKYPMYCNEMEQRVQGYEQLFREEVAKAYGNSFLNIKEHNE